MKHNWQTSSHSFKAILLLSGILCLICGIVIGTKAAMAATLKPVGVVQGDMLTVGDIFDNVSRHSDYVIGAAPQPGQDMTLNARTLYRIASALDLQWRPASITDQITIRREANLVPFSAIETALKNELILKGLDGKFNVELNSGKPTIVLPNNLPEAVEITGLSYDHQKDIFHATLVAPSADNPIKKMSISGVVERLVSIPVLRANLQNGDIIGENDIDIIEVPAKSLQHDTIINKDEMIGMTPV